VDVQIDELVLHGFPHGDRYRIGQALESELTRLIAKKGIPPAIRQEGERESLAGNAVDIPPGSRPDTVGTRVAREVYGRMRR
jgi:hypothetical protein